MEKINGKDLLALINIINSAKLILTYAIQLDLTKSNQIVLDAIKFHLLYMSKNTSIISEGFKSHFDEIDWFNLVLFDHFFHFLPDEIIVESFTENNDDIDDLKNIIISIANQFDNIESFIDNYLDLKIFTCNDFYHYIRKDGDIFKFLINSELTNVLNKNINIATLEKKELCNIMNIDNSNHLFSLNDFKIEFIFYLIHKDKDTINLSLIYDNIKELEFGMSKLIKKLKMFDMSGILTNKSFPDIKSFVKSFSGTDKKTFTIDDGIKILKAYDKGLIYDFRKVDDNDMRMKKADKQNKIFKYKDSNGLLGFINKGKNRSNNLHSKSSVWTVKKR